MKYTFSRWLRQNIKDNVSWEPSYVTRNREIEFPEVEGMRRVLILRKNAENLQKIRSRRRK